MGDNGLTTPSAGLIAALLPNKRRSKGPEHVKIICNNKDIIIRAADKGSCIVVVDKEGYMGLYRRKYTDRQK